MVKMRKILALLLALLTLGVLPLMSWGDGIETQAKSLILVELNVETASSNRKFSGMAEILDHLAETGVNGIWLSWPVGWFVGTVLSMVFYRTSIYRQAEEKTTL